MSRKSLATVLFAFVSCTLLASHAAAQAKVGVINLQRAVLETAEIKKASVALQARFKPEQDKLEALQKELAGIQAKLQNPQTSPAQQQTLQAEGALKQRQAQRIQEDLQADVERDRNDILARAAQRMTEVVQKMADEKGLDVVVDTSNIVYFKPSMEFTQEVIAAYDKAYPAAP